MTDNLSGDPEFPGIVQALGRLLNGPSMEEVTTQLELCMQRAFMIADPEARPIIIGQLNVLKVTHGWIAQFAEHPGASLHTLDAVRDILAAIETGMRGEQL